MLAFKLIHADKKVPIVLDCGDCRAMLTTDAITQYNPLNVHTVFWYLSLLSLNRFFLMDSSYSFTHGHQGSLSLGQSYECSSGSEGIPKDMDNLIGTNPNT